MPKKRNSLKANCRVGVSNILQLARLPNKALDQSFIDATHVVVISKQSPLTAHEVAAVPSEAK